jgi:hypothetical protein
MDSADLRQQDASSAEANYWQFAPAGEESERKCAPVDSSKQDISRLPVRARTPLSLKITAFCCNHFTAGAPSLIQLRVHQTGWAPVDDGKANLLRRDSTFIVRRGKTRR